MARPATPMAPRLTAFEDCERGTLSVKRAARFTSLSHDEIQRAIAAGEIETFRRGRRVLMTKRAVIAWLARMLDAARREQAAQTSR